MRRLVFALLFGLVFIPFPLHAQSVTLNICNTGAVDLDAIFSGGGRVLDSKIRPGTCAAVAKSEGGGMDSAYLGLAFTDSRGQYGAARGFARIPYMGVKEIGVATQLGMKVRGEKIPDPPRTLTLADGSRTVQRGSVSVPLQLLFQPTFPECEKVGTGGGAVFGNTTIIEVTTVCEDLGYTLMVETHLDSHEISLESMSTSGILSRNDYGILSRSRDNRLIFSEPPEIDWAKEAARRKAHEQPVPVKWSDLLSTLRNPRYPPGSRELGEVLPSYFVVRGTVSGVEVTQVSRGPTTNITVAQINFRESPAVPHWNASSRLYPEFNACTERLDILQERFGADFRTSMIGKTIEVHGLPFGEECYGQRVKLQIYLARQIRPVTSALFAADARVWVPPTVVAPPPPRLLTIDELAGNIVKEALSSNYQYNFQNLQAACTDQANNAYKLNKNPDIAENFKQVQAINAQYEACQVAVDGKMAAMRAPQQSAEKAKPCAQQLLKAYPYGGLNDPNGFINGIRACAQAYLGNPSPVPTPAAAPAPTSAAAPVAARPTPAPAVNNPSPTGPTRYAGPTTAIPVPPPVVSTFSTAPAPRAGALSIVNFTSQWVGRVVVATGTVARVETIRGFEHLYFQGADSKLVVCFTQGFGGVKNASELIGRTIEVSARIDSPAGCLDHRVETVGATEIRQLSQLRLIGGAVSGGQPSSVGVPVAAPAAAPEDSVAAGAKALQDQQQRAAQEKLATQKRSAQDALQRAQKSQACVMEWLKAHPDGGQSDPEGYQKGYVACLQMGQAPPAK